MLRDVTRRAAAHLNTGRLDAPLLFAAQRIGCRVASQRCSAPRFAPQRFRFRRTTTQLCAPLRRSSQRKDCRMFKPNAKVKKTVDVLVEAFKALSNGETVTYDILSKLCGEQISSQSYVLQRALRKAEEQTGALFENVMGEGYQRLPSAEIPGVGKRANTRIRKHARKTRKRLETVRANDLSAADFAAVAAYRSHFGMIEGLARENTVKALEKAADTAAFVEPKQVASRMAALMGRK